MAAVTICSDCGGPQNSFLLFPLFPHLFAMKWWDWMPWSSFSECWVLSQLFHSPLPLSSKLFFSSLLSASSVVSSAYLKLLIFLLANLIAACAPSSPAFLMMYSAYKINKQALMYSLDVLLSQLGTSCSMSSSNCCFLTRIQISQEASQVVWYSHLLKNFPQSQSKALAQSIKQKWCFSGTLLLFWWSNGCWQFDLWFLYLF